MPIKGYIYIEGSLFENMSKHMKLKIKKIEKDKCPINIFVYANNY